ncbi:MAG: T9SS type A sorting domain-containing protein, partial [Ignavibacteria bacterium]|nr:T9SS type A sorting domain-containing protein [Ignavibacteria bacterium]
AGGAFGQIGGQTRFNIAKLNNTNGNADAVWDANADDLVYSIAVNGNDIYAAGDITFIGGQPRSFIARLNNTDGAADATWNPSASAGVYVLTANGSDIYAGGNFLTMGSSLQGNFALFTNRILPVELSSFTSNVNSNNVTLNWSTVQEENNKGFEIERKSFGEGWKKIGYIEGKGITHQTQKYSYKDNGLNTGIYSYRLKQIDYNGNFEYHELTSEVIIGVPSKFALAQNYPNPFNPATVISYQLPAAGFVSLKVYDISGREVSSLVNEVKNAGYYNVTFDAKSLSSGTYFYKLSTDKFSDVKKMVVVK